jgi:hypothetical protein
VIFPVVSQSSAIISSKLTKLFPSKHFVFFSDPSNQAYHLVRSFKAFLSSGVLFLVSLFVYLLCVCLCPMIDAIRVNVVRGSRAWKNVKVKTI